MTSIPGEILAIDIGGSHIKATILDKNGKMQLDYEKIITPRPAKPEKVLAAIKELVQHFPAYEKIAVGFPGYLKDGIVITAPNLGTKDWYKVNFTQLLTDTFNKPARVINDADMQGLGVVSCKGLEMMLTLGTGFGTALLKDGILIPHLEMAHHPIAKKQTYDEYVGEKALEKIGVKKWNKRMEMIIEVLRTVFNYDILYIGGGNAAKLTLKLADNIKIVSNEDGIHGGARLWEM
jgi:polyphosphate glucokinase